MNISVLGTHNQYFCHEAAVSYRKCPWTNHGGVVLYLRGSTICLVDPYIKMDLSDLKF